LKTTISLLKLLSQNEKRTMTTQTTGRRSNEKGGEAGVGDSAEQDDSSSLDATNANTSTCGSVEAVGLGRKGGYVNSNRAWVTAFGELVEHINTIIERYASISDNKSDPEMLGILFFI
jgi:hypothetical protein